MYGEHDGTIGIPIGIVPIGVLGRKTQIWTEPLADVYKGTWGQFPSFLGLGLGLGFQPKLRLGLGLILSFVWNIRS
jgi:hypothetical protein